MLSGSAIRRLLSRLRPAKIGKMAAEWAAFASFWLRHSFLRSNVPSPTGKHLLMVSMTTYVPRVIMEGMIAAFCQLSGHRVTVLTSRENSMALRYFRAMGVTSFSFFDDYASRAQRDLPAGIIDDIFAHHLSFRGLYDYVWNDVAVGRQVLSTVVRKLQNGTVAFDDPQVLALLRVFLPEAMVATFAAERVFDAVRPDRVLFLEKGYTPFASICDVALKRGIPVVQYHHAQESSLLNMKRYSRKNKAQHAFSLSPKSWETVRSLAWDAKDEEAFVAELTKGYESGSWFNRKFILDNKLLKTPEQVRAQLGLDPSKKTAVIFSHVLWDATFFFGTNLFPDYETWLLETVKVAVKNTAVNWIIKVHPDYMWKMKKGEGSNPRDTVALREAFGDLPPHVILVAPDTDISTFSFFGITDYCVTVRGTIGIEAPCFGIPVFTAGTGRYSGLGFTHDFQTADEYLAAMARIQEYPRLTPAETTLARKHAFGLFKMRPLRMRSFEMLPVKKADGAFVTDTVIRVRSLAELRAAPDLQAFASWVFSDDPEEDYLAPHDASPARKAMRIALFSSTIDVHNGYGNITYEYCRQLQAAGIDFTLFLPDTPAERSIIETMRPSFDVRFALPPYVFRMYQRASVGYLRRVDVSSYDIVHSLLDFPYCFVAARSAKKYGKPFMMGSQGTYGVFPLTLFPERQMLRWAYRQAKRVVVPSVFTKTLIERYAKESYPIDIIHNGVRFDRFSKPLDTSSVRAPYPGRKILLTVGGLKTRKGQDLVIRALASVVKERPDVAYVMVGEGSLKQSLKDLAESLGVASSVFFAGQKSGEELVRYFQACDIYVHTPKIDNLQFEGFGIVYLEAAACHKPSVATDAGGIRDAVTEQTGIVVPDGDVEGVAKAILALLNDESRRTALGEGAYAYAARHDWKDIVEQFQSVYHELLHV